MILVIGPFAFKYQFLIKCPVLLLLLLLLLLPPLVASVVPVPVRFDNPSNFFRLIGYLITDNTHRIIYLFSILLFFPGRPRDKKEWMPVTKLGRLVKAGKISSIEEIYLHSIPMKEAEIVDYFLGPSLKDEIMKIMPVQRQSSAGQRTRFKAFVAIGDSNGHIGLGVKCSSEVANAIKGALAAAKLSIVPVRRGYWGNKGGEPHTVANKLHGHCGSVRVRIIPAPRGTGLVAAPASKKMLSLAGIHDAYTSTTGHSRTMGNFIKACYFALRKSYGFLTPDMWRETDFIRSPYQTHSDFLAAAVKTA